MSYLFYALRILNNLLRQSKGWTSFADSAVKIDICKKQKYEFIIIRTISVFHC
jgi:hypothetical protein